MRVDHGRGQEEVDAVLPRMEVVVDGDRATVTKPGQEPFVLRRRDGGWRLTTMAR